MKPVFDGCFVCGSNQQSWLLNSKPVNKAPSQPYFPFLKYQLQGATKNKSSNEQCFVCNVCYLFLMQQWDSYERNGTPLVKRLYWTKKFSDGCNTLEGLENEHQVDPPKVNIPVEINRQVDSLKQQEILSLFTCYLCSYRNKEQLSSIVYTVPQESQEVPFFSGIVREEDKDAVQKDGNKILLCKECSSKLHEQWVEYHTNSVPVSERKYDVGAAPERGRLEYSCCLCHDQLTSDTKQMLYYKEVSNEPYYPFLINLNSEDGSICPGGFTFCCLVCKDFLFMQWKVFEKMNVPQEERVYRISQSQAPFLPTVIHRDIQCLLCTTVSPVFEMKRVYCNPGANLHPGVVDSRTIKGLEFYNEDTGESFVCLSCFEVLKHEWRLRCMGSFDLEKQDMSNVECQQRCRICLEESVKLVDVYLKQQKDSSTPYFPNLVDLIEEDSGKDSIKTCRFCQAALLSQWDEHHSQDEIVSKVVHLDLFCCGQCARLVQKSAIARPQICDSEDVVNLVCDDCVSNSKV